MAIKIFIALLLGIALIILFLHRERILGEKNHQPFSNVWDNQHRELARQLLKDTAQILADHNIQVVAAYGTLLGFARHGEIIPWDDDIDVCVSESDISTIWSLKNVFRKRGIGMVKVTITGNSFTKVYPLREPLIPGHKWSWPFIDIFSYTVDGSTVTIDNVGIQKKYKINYDDMFPLEAVTFEGTQIYTPADAKAVLDAMYSENWKDTCVSSSWNHRKEHHYSGTYKVGCDNIIKNVDIPTTAWVINLENRPDRLEITQERLANIGITIQRWGAVDATSPNFVRFYNTLSVPKRSIGEVACYRSHRNLWEYIRDRDLPYALIFEDDAVPMEGVTNQTLADIIQRSAGFDIIYLGHCFSSPMSLDNPVVTPGTAQCLHAYVISRKAIDKILANPDDYSLPIDKITEKHCQDSLCFLVHHIPTDKDTYGQGVIHQDNGLGSNLAHKHLKTAQP